jgi:tetratricopeptide (TPR) repeat protein
VGRSRERWLKLALPMAVGALGMLGPAWLVPRPADAEPWEVAEQIKKAEALVQQDPSSFHNAMGLAWWYTLAGRLDGAEVECEQARSLPRADTAAIGFSLAEVRLARGDIEFAIDDMWTAAEEATDVYQAGVIYERIGDLEACHRSVVRAREAYEKSLMGAAFLLGRSTSTPVRRLAKLAAVGEERKPLGLTLAAALSWGKFIRGTPAIQYLESIEPVYQDEPLLYLVMYHAYRTAKDFDKAGAAIRRAVEVGPDDPAVHYFAAQYVRSQGQPDEAVHHYLEMERTAGGYRDIAGEAHLGLSALYAQRGEWGTAYTSYELALPNLHDEWSPRRLATLSVKAGVPQQAITFLEQHYDEVPLVDHVESGPLVEDWWHIAGARAALQAYTGDFEGMRKTLRHGAQRVEEEGEWPSGLSREAFRALAQAPPEAATLWLLGKFASSEPGEDSAMARYEQVVEVAPDFAFGNVWLASIIKDREPDRAFRLAEKAVATAPPGDPIHEAGRKLIEELGVVPKGE